MKDEIKEIINDFEIRYPNKTKILKDYITNLQEENERYKRIFEGKEKFSKIMPDGTDFIILSKADYDRQQKDIELTAIELKSRNEKAIEYIEKLKNFKIKYVMLEEKELYASEKDFVKDLLNILQGEDKDE